MNGLRTVAFLLITNVLCDNVEQVAKLRYYYKTFDNYTELPLDDADKIFTESWYNSSQSTVIFCHGFTGHPAGLAVEAVIKAYLEQEDLNVGLLNWEYLAASLTPNLAGSYVNWAAPNARKLGVRFADTLLHLSLGGLNLNKTHLVGHSLGAHIFGIAGNTLVGKGIKLPWITGLDPAAAGFQGRLPTRLHSGSAEFVDVIHSDPSKYGYARPMGTVDYWPNFKNGAVRQPGCTSQSRPMFSPEDLCSHNRCWELLVDSLKHPGSLLSCYARNYRTWKNYKQNERESVVLEVGKYYDKVTSGSYFFITDATSPYGRGKHGL